MKILLFKSKDGSISLVEENDYIKQYARLQFGDEKVGEIISDAQNASKFIPFSTNSKSKETMS